MKEYTALEPGTYRVQLMDLRETQLENPQHGTGDVIRFVLECVDELDSEGNRYALDGIANDILTPLSKLTEWLAAFGVSARPGEDIDMSEAVGREAMATVIHKPGKDKTGAFARIDKLVPLPKDAQKAPGRPSAPAVVNPDGTPNYTAFWSAITALGLTKQHVFDHLGTMDLKNLDGADFAIALEELRVKAQS